MIYIESILRQASYWIVLLPFIAGVISFKKLSEESRWVLVLVAAASLPQMLAAISPSIKERQLVYNIYTMVEFLVTAMIFKARLIYPLSRNILYISLLFFSLCSLYFIYANDIAVHFVSHWVCVSNLMYLLWILVVLRESYLYNTSFFSKKDCFTWYVVGLILYACTCMLIFAIYNRIEQSKDSPLKRLWLFHDFSNIFMYCMFTVGIIVDGKQHFNTARDIQPLKSKAGNA